MSLWAILLVLLILLAFSGSGYGYYAGGPYASPLAMLGVLLLVGVIVWLLLGGTIWLDPPPTMPVVP